MKLIIHNVFVAEAPNARKLDDIPRWTSLKLSG